MLTTPLCHTLGMTAPIFSVGMGALAGPTLAVACWGESPERLQPTFESRYARCVHSPTSPLG
jgi:hypothetical protein